MNKNNQEGVNVIYRDAWQPFYKCSKCSHPYGATDPLHSHWKECCPACGAIGVLCPPSIRTARRFCCTKQPSWFGRVFLRKRDTGFYEYKDRNSGGGGGSLGTSTHIPVTGMASTVMIGAISLL